MVKLEKVLRMREMWLKSNSYKNDEEMMASKKKLNQPAIKTKGFNFPKLSNVNAPLYASDNIQSTATWQTLTRVAIKEEG